MFNAFIFDIYRWGIFIICSDNSHHDLNESNNVQIKQKKLRNFIIFIQFIILVTFGSIIIGLSLNFNNAGIRLWYDVKSIVTIICFSIFLIVYLVVFGVLIVRLKAQYPNFYKMQNKRIFTVASLLIFSMLSKILIQSIYSVNIFFNSLDESLRQDTWLFPLVEIFSLSTCIILPLCVMTYSLMQTLTERKIMAQQ